MDYTKRRHREDAVAEKRRALVMYHGHVPTQSQLELRNYNKLRADLIVIDESNSFSEKGRGGRKHLTIVCSRVSDYKRFADISDRLPVEKGKRSKHSSMSVAEIGKVVQTICKYNESELAIVEQHRYIDYDNLNNPESKIDFYVNVLNVAIQKCISLNPNCPMIIIIDNPPLRMFDQLWALGEMLSEAYPALIWFETRQSSGTRVLQTHDIITGVISDHVEGKSDRGFAFEMLKKYIKNRINING